MNEDKEICIENYKSRKTEYKFTVCKCGHYRHDHELVWFWHGQCEECMCNKYRKLGEFTPRELQELKVCEEN